jgi:hypothetical protein
MKRYRLDPKKPRQLSKTDLARIDRMKDSDIDYSDIPPLDDEFFKKPSKSHPHPRSHEAHAAKRAKNGGHWPGA